MTVAEQAFEQLMRLAGRERPDFVTFDEGPAGMKTRFHAEAAAAAALAAGGTLAADLWKLRSGQDQEVRVSTREAGAALVSFALQTFQDPSRAPPSRPDDAGGGGRGTPAMGFFRAKDDRWVFLHPSFPASAAKLHELMGSPADAAAVAATALTWDALDLENAIASAGICGAMVRSPEEWDASEQGRILAARPLVEVVKIADGPPMPLPARGDAALAGVRVLDLTRVLAGPTCGRTLAQYGADVLYVASPKLPATEFFVSDVGHGKLSTWLDLTDEADRARLSELIASCDVFSQGYRLGSLQRMGLGAVDLARLRPGIVYTSINAYGHEGPWANRPGWEQLAQTVTGLAHVHGSYTFGGEKGPQLQPGAVTDYTTGFLAAFGTMVALDRRARFGGSYMVRVSLAQTGMWLRSLGLAGPGHLDSVQPPTPEEIDGWRIESDSGFGAVRHLRPPVMLSATPARWRRPTTPLGFHEAAWPS
ncbi:CoA transferase [Phenylobacterium sp. LH3H17]|uniref:CoA transferase n=1 Tax=Phenylobacterium sp. LH3H17 TaxID=2903901 RepID=UPI0020C96D1A|nr:CoA transferase [Phenylobacterium sp. LH3H17]UTP37772.1 CoA transferase [Phenylobacterium sp. LH3H17]